MYKSKPTSPISKSPLRFYVALVISIIVIVLYRYSLSKNSSVPMISDQLLLPKTVAFTYANISSQIHLNEAQGVLFVPPLNQPAHFGSIKSNAVRGNHRHVGDDNPILSEVIVLLHGKFLVRIGDGSLKTYEDHIFDVSKSGVIALQLTAEKCHAVKNIGEETNWFASYYIKSSDILKAPPVDRRGCNEISLY